MVKKKIIIKESVLRQLIKESFDRVVESGHAGWNEEDWNPNYPDDDNEEDPDEEPFDFDETYYKDR